MKLGPVLIGYGLALLGGCPAAPTDPAPPPGKLEILPAPPRALGAHAAGTDAAPKPEVTTPPPDPESTPAPAPAPPGAAPGGSAAPGGEDAPAPHPDGTAL